MKVRFKGRLVNIEEVDHEGIKSAYWVSMGIMLSEANMDRLAEEAAPQISQELGERHACELEYQRDQAEGN